MALKWDAIKGLPAALGKDGVTSNYHPEHCRATAKFIDAFQGGQAVFTQPNMPIKCAGALTPRSLHLDRACLVWADPEPLPFPRLHPFYATGAPQKIMYIFEDRMRRAGLREKTQITFMQGMPTIFGIKK
jgi:sulfide:quinone oxidoreductase